MGRSVLQEAVDCRTACSRRDVVRPLCSPRHRSTTRFTPNARVHLEPIRKERRFLELVGKALRTCNRRPSVPVAKSMPIPPLQAATRRALPTPACYYSVCRCDRARRPQVSHFVLWERLTPVGLRQPQIGCATPAPRDGRMRDACMSRSPGSGRSPSEAVTLHPDLRGVYTEPGTTYITGPGLSQFRP